MIDLDNHNNTVTDEVALYDDYFDDPSQAGVEAVIEHKGKQLKFRLKKSLNIAAKQAASDAGVAFTVDANGTPKITKMDQGAYSAAIVLAGVIEWPFKYGRGSNTPSVLHGQPVPINKTTVNRLDGVLLEKIATIILGQREAQQVALDPFVQKSDED